MTLKLTYRSIYFFLKCVLVSLKTQSPFDGFFFFSYTLMVSSFSSPFDGVQWLFIVCIHEPKRCQVFGTLTFTNSLDFVAVSKGVCVCVFNTDLVYVCLQKKIHVWVNGEYVECWILNDLPKKTTYEKK